MGLPILLLSISLILHSCLFLVSARTTTYIVRMKHAQKPAAYATHADWYSDHLQSLTSAAPDSVLYSYQAAYNGFAAALSPEEVETLRKSDSVLGVYEDTLYSLHTTRSPAFLGLNTQVGPWDGHSLQELNQASQDVIIGVLDTGVWPESRSFNDRGMPDVPSRWRGECVVAYNFDPKTHCNKKLIGARYFSRGYNAAYGLNVNSPRDDDGHGTHTASTAAGSPVWNASLFGYARGNARGMANRARLAVYRVCYKSGCLGSDILAAIDQAIVDGVDVLSMSIGGGSERYNRDTIAIGTFAAMQKGIVSSCSAGNSGPGRATLTNVAPWILTVGAGTIDRDFPAFATLGNGRKYTGVSLYSGKGMGTKPVELVYAKGSNTSSSNLCLAGSLDPTMVRGKVVLCDRGMSARVEKGAVVRAAGGAGMILANTATSGEELVADSHLLPAVAVGKKVGDEIRQYVKTVKKASAVLSFGGTVVRVKPSPVVAAFSSRGPNTVTAQILKPDVIGPGVNILAAWPNIVGPTGLEKDTRKTPFNILSGTSMSCPHISGVAALLKAAHPEWSPSAIKSALMTTAYTVDTTNSSLRDAADYSISTPLAHGAGYVDAHKALSPGLIYDATPNDYVAFLCSLEGYTHDMIQSIVKHTNVTCGRKFRDPGQLNYPSFSVVFGKSRVVRYTRQLTNVGAAGSVYEATVESPPSVTTITVKPKRLVFKGVGSKQRYTVTFVSSKLGGNSVKNPFGSITWKNSEHQVRSPISFAWSSL